MDFSFYGNCYICNSRNETTYQVRIINETTGCVEFVKCCCLEHAEKAKKENANIHKRRYEDAINQSIQKLN